MGEREQKCEGCGVKHLAALWYYREGETDMIHWIKWMCGAKYSDLSVQEMSKWRLWELDIL